mmetsp:Transcript_19270/g.47269  ORF Transcript_19270/g.47269 Transcript_19270/m.47269 type:complete len:203 (-) Transcript_19270:667-1275(-)|eukprot:CAMPEP_0198359696 /NCGR_PEP_ID=MMETSP1450-20131203/135591_1 /TAXON_ID=753684 ORGANISM="Madagascaria erythrocladiodes, Strain CCMP3234" /NCGR_SAMPLE_ID=MMETSP1450 /ASSEMBLY_ACC=CAM_ASM_001115 /LENGTH=202 /DNA_ID=CAMNT_0044066601 /DNA_START=88 /DNA_END=696 /DNA_ORIENTATION=+
MKTIAVLATVCASLSFSAALIPLRIPSLERLAEGQCQDYNWGGDTGVHFYTCCNNEDGSACQGVEYDGASDGQYCGSDGADTGDGSTMGPAYSCGGCDGQTKCKDWCDGNAISFPGMCWNWQDCFRRCCADGDPSDGVDGWISIRICTEKSRNGERLITWSGREEEECTQCTEGYVPEDADCLEECGSPSPSPTVSAEPDYA